MKTEDLQTDLPFDVQFQSGRDGRPMVVFIHGMGMNVRAWSEPSEARVLGGKYPLSVLAGDEPELRTSFSDLQELGFPVLSWTQSRPVGPIAASVRELRQLMRTYEGYASRGVVFICHSRGGLIARKFLEEEQTPLKALITLATPHRGTSMARLASAISPMAFVLRKLLRGFSRAEVETAFQRVLGFLSSTGLKELLPDSDFFAGLKDRRREGVLYLSLGGTNPDLLRAVSLSLPDLISKMVPEVLVPREMRPGLGDGLVSAESSVFPWTDEHMNFPVNHASILFDVKVRKYIRRKVESLR
jgi:pimeloyl-ACP methyl ester carboxylesterase